MIINIMENLLFFFFEIITTADNDKIKVKILYHFILNLYPIMPDIISNILINSIKNVSIFFISIIIILLFYFPPLPHKNP